MWRTPKRCLWRFALIAVAAFVSSGRAPLVAQGVTTAAISGAVRSENGSDVDGTLVRVRNRTTGGVVETRVRSGVYLVDGLAPGGVYDIDIRHIGFVPWHREGVVLELSERWTLDVVLAPIASRLETVSVVVDDARAPPPRTSYGAGSSISDSTLRRLPTLNRDLYDFVRLAPLVATRVGLSGGGASFRLNSFLIDGVSDRQLQGNGVMGGPNGGKSISLEAVQEYQVLLTPFDARYGDFTGLLVNVVTKSGTNELHGSAFGYMRNAQLARSSSFVGGSAFERQQYGFSLGGPLVRDRAFFFVASDLQHATAPAPGPFIGQAPDAAPRVPVSAGDVARFAALLRANGLDAGDGGRVMLPNPTVALFSRVDVSLPEWKSRLVLRHNYSRVEVSTFARSGTSGVFPLTSVAGTARTTKQTAALQMFTQFSFGVFNEFQLAYTDNPMLSARYARSPTIQVGVTPDTGFRTATTAQLSAGPGPAAGNAALQRSLELGDHLVFRAGSRHTFGAGVQVAVFNYYVTGVRNGFGQWRFNSLDAFANGDASSFMIAKDFGSATAPVRGMHPSAYVTDEWRVGGRLSLTLGLRAEALAFGRRPTFNAAIDSVFHRRTSDYPAARVHWSPRMGFRWQPDRDGLTSVHGGAGMFAGRPPLGWLLGPMRSNGAGVRTLNCTPSVFPGRMPPKFVPDPLMQPDACADGSGFSDGPVALVDRSLKMPQWFRTALTIERLLGPHTRASIGTVYSRVQSDLLFSNINLQGPQGVDAHGRVMYGTIDARGIARPALVESGRFPEVIDLRNHSFGHAWSLTGQVNRPFVGRSELHASYTYSRVRDAQSLTSMSAVAPMDIWASARFVSARHDALSTGISAFDIPHRVVVAATYVGRWKRQTTDVSVYYIGESGSPFTYGDSTAGGMGDLNADGTSANDPIYVPRDATDASEIVFAGSDSTARVQGVAFERFIRDTPCLRRQRGRIAARNSCRGSWVSTANLSVRQSLPAFAGHRMSLQLEVFDVLNLLNSAWGLLAVPNTAILQHAGQTTGASSRPRFTFDPTNVRSTRNIESGYQFQLALRYGF